MPVAALIHLLTDFVEAPFTALVHSHSLVPLQFADRRGIGIPGSAADLAGLTPGHKLRSRVGKWRAGKTQPWKPSSTSAQSHAVDVHDYDTQHSPDHDPFLRPRRRIPLTSECTPYSTPLSLHCRRRLPRTYLRHQRLRSPPAGSTHLLERPPSPAPRAPPRLLAVPSPRRNRPAVEQRPLQTPRAPSCCRKNRCRPSCRPRRCRGRICLPTMSRLRHPPCSPGPPMLCTHRPATPYG